MAFSFGTPTNTNPNTNQQSAPSFSFGTTSANQSSSLFGNQQNNAIPGSGFNFGGSNNQTQGQSQAKPAFSFGNAANAATTTPAPFSFGSTNNNATNGNTGGLFGQTSQAPATGNSLFGQNNSSTQQSGGLFGQAAQTTQPSSGLFGFSTNQNNTPSSGAGLFGSTSQQNSQPANGLFGSTSQQNNQPASGLFGQSMNQQPQQSSGGLFGSTAQPIQNQFVAGVGQDSQNVQQSQQQSKPQPTLAQSVYGQTLSQPQFTWSRSSHQNIQPTMPTFNMNSSTMTQAKANTLPVGQNLNQSFAGTQSSYGPLQPASIQDQLVRLKNAWDPSHPDCMFQAYFYNRVAPETASLYTKPEDHKQSAWEEAVAARPDDSVVPVLARGFTDLQARLNVQQQQIIAYRTRMHEIADKLKELDDRHLLHATPKVEAARRTHLQLTRRALKLATKVQVLKCRGYALRPEEEQLRAQLQTLESRLKDPNTFGRLEEIWAKMTVLRQYRKAAEDDIKAKGYVSYINFDEGDSLENIQHVLRDFNNGLLYVSGVVKSDLDKVEAEIEKYKAAQGGLDKSRNRQ